MERGPLTVAVCMQGGEVLTEEERAELLQHATTMVEEQLRQVAGRQAG